MERQGEKGGGGGRGVESQTPFPAKIIHNRERKDLELDGNPACRPHPNFSQSEIAPVRDPLLASLFKGSRESLGTPGVELDRVTVMPEPVLPKCRSHRAVLRTGTWRG